MKVRQAIELARGLKQIDQANYPDILMLQFLNECEGKLQTEFLHIADVDCQRYTEDDMDMDLIVGPPHDKLYYAYLCAMVDFTNGEYAKYNNSIIVANAFMAEWAAWFNRTHERDGRQYLGVFLSAYGIAVKHGYAGTEEEWLESLRGPEGQQGIQGKPGPQGEPGSVKFDELTEEQLAMLKGKEGPQGVPGIDGQDGVGIQSVEQTTTSTEDGGTNVVTVTKTDGTSSVFQVKNGSKGSTGQAGTAGQDGVSPSVSVSEITGGHRVSIQDADGTSSFDVMDGKDGAGGGTGLPFDVEILETICENVELTYDNNTYTLPAEITLDREGLYCLDYKAFIDGLLVDSSSGVYFSRATEGDVSYIRWFSSDEYNVTLESTQITDSWMSDSSILSIYKVSLNVSDGVLDAARKLEGYYNIASGNISHAEGERTTASGCDSHAEGYVTTASGYASHAEGNETTASGHASHAEGNVTTASNYASHAHGKYNKAMTTGGAASNTTGDAMVIGNGTSSSALSNAFRVTYAGAVYGLSAFNSSGADYAEFFEWADLNPDAEDRVGFFVTMEGEQIRIAGPGDYILGIVSGQPCIIGNADEDWQGRWLHDEFGRFVKETTEDPVIERRKVEVPVLDEDGNPTGETKMEMQEVETGEVIHGWRYKANPNYDNTQEYIERKDRKEWDCVGMLGVLAVRDDGTCEVNGFCQVADGGIATVSDTYVPGSTYRVIERVTENVIKVVFR